MEFLNKKSKVEADLFLHRLKEKSIPNLSKLPIEEGLCKKGLLLAFEEVVESGLHKYVKCNEQEDKLGAVAHWLVSHKQKWGLILNGIPGNGKTTTLLAVRKVVNALELEDPNPFTYDKVAGLYIKTAKELCEVCVKDKKAFEQYKSTVMLAIDEFGIEPTEIASYGNIYTPLSDLLAYRYEKRLFTILTTNIQNSDIRPKYGDRIAARMNEMFEIVNMPDVDFRKPLDEETFLNRLK